MPDGCRHNKLKEIEEFLELRSGTKDDFSSS
jgi:hypothetical protein